METIEKLRLLSEHMDLEPTSTTNSFAEGFTCNGIYVQNASLPNGKRMRLFKSLLSSACVNNCTYCPFRASRDFHRVSLTPEEYAKQIHSFYQVGLIQGAFISSAIAGKSISIQDKLIQTAEILRKKYLYRGYLHIKIMPGAELEQIKHTMQLADRVSLNLEAPNQNRLSMIAPEKDFDKQLITGLQYIAQIKRSEPAWFGWNNHWPSLTTQFVVGGADESDREILSITAALTGNLQLKRAYFSAFRPFNDTPLANHPTVPLRREQRLYQASFLLRDYGFALDDLSFDGQHNLLLNIDPKTAWAKNCLSENPVEINSADKRELMRIPGIGPKSAERILKQRIFGTISNLTTLTKMGIRTQQSAPFILIDGKRPATQMSFFTSWNFL